jgi:hypothetical protein
VDGHDPVRTATKDDYGRDGPKQNNWHGLPASEKKRDAVI